ncbi:MAG: glycosyltransferase family 4 protein [Rhodoferax sp.]|nr:glycosyltransferase family 4 protein [Rhodoferax sp.]
MRVLHAYNQHRGGGGANNVTQATIELQRAQGLQVEVLARNALHLPQGLRGLPGRLEAGTGVVWGGSSVREFRALLERFQPQVVHVHEIYPMVSPWILPECTRRGIPVVMSCVDFRMTCPLVTHTRDGRSCTRCLDPGREWHAIRHNCRGSLPESAASALYNVGVRALGLFARHVDHYIAPSAFAGQWLVRHAGLPADRLSVISPPVHMPDTAADAAQGSYIAYAGRFAPEKGLPVFAAAARATGLPFRMARHHASLVTTDVPAGPEVVVTHDAAELQAFYRGARALVLPSLWFETFGLVGAEAMSHGIPVIGSRLGSVADLIEEGVDGLLFEAGDAQALARQVRLLWDDPSLAARMGQAARAKALSHWAPQRHAEQVLQVYETLLSRAGRPAGVAPP